MASFLKSRRKITLCHTTLVAAGIFSTLFSMSADRRAPSPSSFLSTDSDEAPLVETLTTNALHVTSILQQRSPDISSSLRWDDGFEGVNPRAFDPWPENQPLPCFEPSSTESHYYNPFATTTEGILFMKPYKTGSSTSSGVNLRISRGIARRLDRKYDRCKARQDHGPWMDMPAASMYSKRVEGRSFLWTIVREPTNRVVSLFFHMQVSRMGVQPTDANFRRFLLEENVHKKYDYYLHNLALRPFNTSSDDPAQLVNGILQSYNFIGITERMDESYVALAMLLRLPMSDVMYLSAKTSGGYDDGVSGHCTYIQPSFVSDGMREFFEGDEWQAKVRHDRSLFQAANRSLDLTIDRLGRSSFERNLRLFREAQKAAHDRCLESTVFPCDRDGNFFPPDRTDCAFSDYGCGFECLDRVALDLGL